MSDHVEPDGGKRCTRCGQYKPADEYSWRRGPGRMYRHSRCKQCIKEIKRLWHRANKERRRATELKRHYGLTLLQMQELIDQQGGVDPITGEPIGLGDNVDHNHRTGRVRGVLKAHTNIALGCLRD